MNCCRRGLQSRLQEQASQLYRAVRLNAGAGESTRAGIFEDDEGAPVAAASGLDSRMSATTPMMVVKNTTQTGADQGQRQDLGVIP